MFDTLIIFKLCIVKNLLSVCVFLMVSICAVQTAKAQEKTYKFVIKDELGFSLPGVSLIIEGTQIRTSTNIEGEATLTLPWPLPNQTIKVIITRIGFEKQEITITNNGGPVEFTITMKYDSVEES